MNEIQYELKTKIRPLYLVASESGLRGVYWHKLPIPLVKQLNPNDHREKILMKTIQQLEEYFAGKRKEFKLPFDLNGTAFQKKVWQELFKIPFGETVSYSDIAQRIKNPRAVRAVGTANGRNPICVIIPCHRVISAAGTLGGYSSGLAIKKQLLELEGAGV